MAFSDGFLTEKDAFEEFKRILSSLPGYDKLQDSQIIEGMSLFQSWALRQASWRAERAHQESFISTAINRSSVLAGAESRQYLPRKPIPSRGEALFINSGNQPVSIPAESVFVGSNQLRYQTADDLVVPAGNFATVEIRQTEMARYEFVIETTKPFYEIHLGRQESTRIHSLKVFVDGVEWRLMPRLMNTHKDARAYDEFYTSLDEIGLRFGNGVFGRIPSSGAKVVIEATLTEGQTELIPGQELRYVSGSQDHNVGLIEGSTRTRIAGGRPREDIEEVRRNAMYYPLYDEQLVWRDDYKFVMRRIWPEAVFVNAWGEHEMEQAYGFNVEHIGKIYISAYSPERPGILEEMTERLEQPISRKFVAVAPNFKPFVMHLEGRIERSIPLEKALTAVRNSLLDHYGKDSRNRLLEVKLKDFYRLITATGLFEMGDFTIELFGDRKSNGMEDVVHLDYDSSIIEVGYE